MFAATVQAGDIKVMSDSPLEPALTKVVAFYRQQTHNQGGLVFDPSPVVKKRIENGEAADVVIIQPDFAEDLTKSGKVNAGDRPIIVHVGVGLGNRKDGPAYDISTVEKLKNTLLGADLLVFNGAVSNVKRNTRLIERKYQVEKQVQAWWGRLRTASGMHVWHDLRRKAPWPASGYSPEHSHLHRCGHGEHLPKRYGRRVHQIPAVARGKGDFRRRRCQVNYE